MFKGFKEFITRGSVIDLAVAVVIGAAFTQVVDVLVESVFNPVVGAIFNAESLNEAFILQIPLITGTAELKFGAVIAVIIQFILTAAVIYFAFVLPINTYHKRREERIAKGEAVEEDVAPTEQELLTEIRDLLKNQAQQ